MKKFINNFSEILIEISGKIASNLVLNIISSSFMMTLPVVMMGSVFALLKGFDFGGYQSWLMGSGNSLYLLFDTAYNFTIQLLSVYLVFCITYQFALRKGLNRQGIGMGIFGIISFLIITPYNLETSSISFSWLGSRGMFVAIITAFIVGIIFKVCDEQNIRIKLPDAVPPEVSNQFSMLIPGFITIITFMIINYLFSLTSLGNVQDAVYNIVRIPLGYVGNSIFGYFILIMSMYLFWFFGIHGGMTVGPLIMMIFMQLQMENLAAYQAGGVLPHLVVGSHISVGTGPLSLLVASLLISKSKANISISKIAIVPAFFGVDEPAYFGMPMILNPILFLPFVVFVPALQIFGTYILQLLKLVPYANGMQVIGHNPFFVTNFLIYGWQGCLAGFAFFVLAVLIYLPFIKMYDKQCLLKENREEV